MAYNGGFLGPWEAWRRVGLFLGVGVAAMMVVFVAFPLGWSALLLLLIAVNVWKGIGVTDPTLGQYHVGTQPFKVALFFMAYKARTAEILSPRVALGFGPPSADPDHDLQAGWFPASRLSSIWSLIAALGLSYLDIPLHSVLHPIWGPVLPPVWLSYLFSIPAWMAILQSCIAVGRLRAGSDGMLAVEPAPAVMLTKVRSHVQMAPILVKSLVWGVAPAFVLFVLSRAFNWPWSITGIVLLASLCGVGLFTMSRLVTSSYREAWSARNDRRDFWEGLFTFMRDQVPVYVGEAKLPTLEEWNNGQHNDDEPYAPETSVATFAFPQNVTYGNYHWQEHKIRGGLGAAHVSIAPIGESDAMTGGEKPGTIGARGMRVWWTERQLTMRDLTDPELDQWLRELAVRALVMPILGDIRGLGDSIMKQASMMTRPNSKLKILAITLIPDTGVMYTQFLNQLATIKSALGVPWVGVYQSVGGTEIKLMLGDDINSASEENKVVFTNPATMHRRVIDTANWMYYFTQAGQVPPPELVARKPVTALVDELTFSLAPGTSFNYMGGTEDTIKPLAGLAFMEISQAHASIPRNATKEVTEKVQRDAVQRFQVVVAKEDPLSKLFEFGQFTDKLIKPRVPGEARTKWYPGVLSNDQLAEDDFDSDMPHLLIAGSSGSGKSVVLHDGIVQWIANNGPEDLRLHLVEPKIGLQRYQNVDIVDRFIDSWYPSEDFFESVAEWSEELVAEMLRRNRILRDHKGFIPEKLHQARQIADFQGPLEDGSPHPLKLPFLFAVIEECATIFADPPKEYGATILKNLFRVAREGRSAGIHMIMTTQYPTNASIPSPIRNQMRRIGLSCQNGLASRVVIEENGLERLHIKGTGKVKEGGGYRSFRGFWLRDGNPDMGEANDTITALQTIPQKGGKPITIDGTIRVPDPDATVFQAFERKTGVLLERAIDLEKNTKDSKE